MFEFIGPNLLTVYKYTRVKDSNLNVSFQQPMKTSAGDTREEGKEKLGNVVDAYTFKYDNEEEVSWEVSLASVITFGRLFSICRFVFIQDSYCCVCPKDTKKIVLRRSKFSHYMFAALSLYNRSQWKKSHLYLKI